MNILKNNNDLTNIVQSFKAQGQRVAYVPTMGALHEGHLSLVALAKQRADRVVVSIFVNPTQFAPHEDFDAYPRDLDRDAAQLAKVGVDALYAPRVQDIYPEHDDALAGDLPALGESAHGLEGACRPGHFAGVSNVVYRLFDQIRPDVAIFGEKDFQQLQVIRDMVAAKSLPIDIVGAPIARDEFGLALSSRNAYLSAAQLDVARQLNRVLLRVVDGDLSVDDAPAALLSAGFDRVDYVARRWGRVLAAAFIEQTRLIDNMAC